MGLVAALLVACLLGPGVALGGQEHALQIGELPHPGKVPEGLVDGLETRSFTLTKDGEPVLSLWLRREIPADTGEAPTGERNYATLEQGAMMGVLEVVKPHLDYRDQMVPTGVFALRHLSQPVDGDHSGVTYFRDFLVVNPLRSNTTAASRRFDSTLAAALQLNTHPYVWGLWPAREVATDTVPALVAVDGDKYALVVELTRDDGSTLRLAVILVGSQPPDGYYHASLPKKGSAMGSPFR